VWSKLIAGIERLVGNEVFKSRRFILGAFSVSCLTAIAIYKGIDTSVSIAAIAVGIAGSNAYQGAKDPQGKVNNNAKTE